MDISKGLGKKIQEYRKKQGLTQEKMAEFVGIDTVSISKIENGKIYPASKNLEKICKILNVEPYELFLFSEKLSEEALLGQIEKTFEILKKDKSKLLVLNGILKSLI